MTPLAHISSPSDIVAALQARALALGVGRDALLRRAGLSPAAFDRVFLQLAGKYDCALGKVARAFGVRFVAIPSDTAEEN